MENIINLTIRKLNRQSVCLLIGLIISLSGFSQNVGINSTGAAPNSSAGLDVDFPNKGLLIPRVALTGTANFAPLLAHVAGMIVFNTATVSDVIPGFYYNNGTKWVAGFPAGNAIGNMLYWNGTDWVLVPAGLPGQFLQVSGTNIPIWGAIIAVSPNIITTAATNITGTSASSGANIPTDGGSPILARGVCWNILTGPTIANSKTTDGSGIGSFVSSLTGLLPGTAYYVKGYAMNSTTISYGNEITFTTLPVLPTLGATTAATLITASTATTGGNVTATGGSPITERGICYSTTVTAPTIANTKLVDPAPGLGAFVSNMTGLLSNTLYYVRSYATNVVGTAYGALTTFYTRPSITTTAATLITGGSATTGGVLTAAGGTTNIWYYGVAYSTTSNAASPTLAQAGTFPATSPITFTTTLTGLTANTTYYIRGYVTGSGYTVYGPELSFTTLGATAPTVSLTNAITGKSANTATSGGSISNDGGSPVTAKGVCWNTSPSPTIGVGNFTSNGTGTTAFVSNITGLTGNTTYYVRAYATNAIGTSYGPVDVSFKTWIQAPYAIGQNVGYGICGYVDSLGGGFIVSPDMYPTSPATTFTWGCNGTHVAVGTAFGTGKANTDLIIASCGTNTAAGYAKAFNGGGFNDWYLPSNGEWAIISANYNFYGLYGPYASYFTSSEYGTNYTYASSYFYTGSQAYASGSPRVGDTYTVALRAIRSFTGVSAPSISTATLINITSTGATSGGTIGSDGGAPVTARGVCWSTTTGPTIVSNLGITNDGTGTGTFTSTITGLTTGITYYVRAYATNSAGTSYGNELSFAPVAPVIPTLTTDPITSLTATTATAGGNISSDGGSVLTAYGVVWNTVTAPTITTNAGITNDFAAIGPLPLAFVSSVTGLTAGTTYYLRAYATTSTGTAYGNEVSFTPIDLPTVTTDIMGSLVGVVAEGNYTVMSEGGAPVTAVGLVWGTSLNPTTTVNSGIVTDPFWASGLVGFSFPLDMSGLTVNTLYHVRAYATNSFGTAYGADITFTATAATLGQTVFLNYQSGVVFSLSNGGANGLIGLLYSPGTTDWGCTSTITGATGTILGTGNANTNAIIANITTNSCVSATFTGFAPNAARGFGAEWYLPSKDEMDLLWTNRGLDPVLDAALSAAQGLAPFWCSSEVSVTTVWYFDGTTWFNTGLKTDQNNVWPIRSF